MTSVDTARDVAVLWTLDFDAELPCEATHNYGEYACSGSAAWLIEMCRGRVAVCNEAADRWKSRTQQQYLCRDCRHPLSECTVAFSKI